MNKTLIIDKEFRGLIPPLTPEEFNQLEQNCLNDGILESIKVWKDVIIDGHNRHEIACKNGLDFAVTELNFESRTDAIEWIILHQLGRRNLTEEQKAYLRGKRYENEKLKVGTRTDLTFPQNEGKSQTAEKLADEYNVSKATIERDADFAKGVDLLPEDRRTDVLSGKSELKKQEVQQIGKIRQQVERQVKSDTIMRTEEDIQAEIEFKAKELAAKEIRRIEEEKRQKKEQKSIEIARKREEYQERISTRAPDNLFVDIFNTAQKFRIIYADPPWSYNDKCDKGGVQSGGVELRHYNTMSIKEICDIPIKNISEDNSVLFLWVTSPLLEDSFSIINAWGFKYKTSFVWDKVGHNMGHYNSVRHEMLLIATRGSCTPDNKTLYDSVQSIEKTDKHSQKPIEFLNIIDDLYIYGDRIELFARERQKDGWFLWGNEI